MDAVRKMQVQEEEGEGCDLRKGRAQAQGKLKQELHFLNTEPNSMLQLA